mgnify:CR=1 FL=1
MFHASPSLLTRLNPGKPFDRAGEAVQVPGVALPPLANAVTPGMPAILQE